MDSQTAVRQEEPAIRLFKSDFLEFFSHISPIAVAAIWTPIVLFFFARSFVLRPENVSALYIPAGVLIGWFVWTFCEYTLHRYLFHYHPRTERLKRMFFLMHGVHHAQPMCRTRLVMPPALSVPMSFVFFGAAYLIFVPVLGLAHWLNPVFAGLVGGYLAYDLMHYSIHHSSVKSGWWFEFRKHHLRHHGACDFMRFGVTTTLWDRVFGTLPSAPCAELLEQRVAKQSN